MGKKKKDKSKNKKKLKEVNVPMKFNLGTLKFEPQIGEAKEKIDEMEEIKNGKRK